MRELPKETRAKGLMILLFVVALPGMAFEGYIDVEGETTFVLGMYEFPEDPVELPRMAEAGINLIRCRTVAQLDAVAAAGMQGWAPLPLHEGATEALREHVTAFAAHPALAVWEGPDEVIWNFTAFSGLKEREGISADDWRNQAPHALAYAEKEAARILPNMGEAIALIREIDTRGRPVWMNEARETDVIYMREYLPWIDVLSCDDYPVKQSGESDLHRVARATDRYMQVSLGKPVWMVLQAFSWEDIREDETDYPSFAESRYMAYACIAHGARGLLHWGSEFCDNADFRDSLYALTSELAALNPFLVAPEVPGVEVTLVEAPDEPANGVRVITRRNGNEWLIALANDDNYRHLGTQVSGLEALEGRELHELYSTRSHRVSQGMFVTRMQDYDVQVFCTSRDFESDWKTGREYVDEVMEE
jgi:hypothetical protein